MKQDMQLVTPSDEFLIHQTAETFATVSQADYSWTEKVWLSMFARDGSLQIDFGLGKYINRNVFDGFAGISRGVEQITVRASREYDDDPERLGVGPIDYEIIEPMRALRCTLRENDVQPLSFDVVFTPIMAPFLERKDAQRGSDGFRVASDLRRFHQLGTVSGWVEVDGKRTDITDETWLGYRDRSWGVRMDVGSPAPDVKAPDRMNQNFILTWSPMYFEPADGSDPYEIHHYLQWVDGEVHYFSGFLNHADGSQQSLYGIADDLKYDVQTRRLLGGTITFDAGWGGSTGDRDRAGVRHRIPSWHRELLRIQGR
ncbi:hypothetical protein [Gordonia otitidis]|uniref:Uncharacterized protein n=1 Tax=Gordonia otitidis (strain DSM 44809 / CCUG 52243 / JCM 12355 / NBRC 100426 / IFM 10032) TaxID=1108044 RepID=H5TN32_GORO1|nr:hypothetical protein [Gordonia otitidis]GAB34890.1 hypothetical protein GOOTI_128_00340 [Gordonia otitidis NBRC 100426]